VRTQESLYLATRDMSPIKVPQFPPNRVYSGFVAPVGVSVGHGENSDSGTTRIPEGTKSRGVIFGVISTIELTFSALTRNEPLLRPTITNKTGLLAAPINPTRANKEMRTAPFASPHRRVKRRFAPCVHRQVPAGMIVRQKV
jgi:hypothetical protein